MCGMLFTGPTLFAAGLALVLNIYIFSSSFIFGTVSVFGDFDGGGSNTVLFNEFYHKFLNYSNTLAQSNSKVVYVGKEKNLVGMDFYYSPVSVHDNYQEYNQEHTSENLRLFYFLYLSGNIKTHQMQEVLKNSKEVFTYNYHYYEKHRPDSNTTEQISVRSIVETFNKKPQNKQHIYEYYFIFADGDNSGLVIDEFEASYFGFQETPANNARKNIFVMTSCGKNETTTRIEINDIQYGLFTYVLNNHFKMFVETDKKEEDIREFFDGISREIRGVYGSKNTPMFYHEYY